MILFPFRTDTPNSKAFAMKQKLFDYLCAIVIGCMYAYIVVALIKSLTGE